MRRQVGLTMSDCFVHGYTNFIIFDISSDYDDGKGKVEIKVCELCYNLARLYELVNE